MTNRRAFLGASAAGLMALGLPFPAGLARANPLAGGNLKFIFVFNGGGWDPTRTLQPLFDNPNVAMEADAERGRAGDLDYVSHWARPSVDRFFGAWHDRTLVLNGMLVRSIAHEICTMLAFTGDSSGAKPGWPAILAAEQRAEFILPHMVLAGPSFPGNLGVAVARAGGQGQLDALVDGSALDLSPTGGPSRPVEGVLDRYMLRRTEARADGTHSEIERALAQDFHRSQQQALALKDMQYVMDFSVGTSLADMAQTAADAMTLGIARCATLQFTGTGGLGWDSHADNDDIQSQNWEGLFDGLTTLMEILQRTPGETEPTLLDETCVVVMSEMGRTPALNTFAGKDHWPYTSAMLLGAGFQGGRAIGGFDSDYYGQNIDPASGETGGDQIFSAEALGATLLAMADIDPGPYVSGVLPISGVLP